MAKKTFKVLQLTDMHLFCDPKTSFIGINPYVHLDSIVKSIAGNKEYCDADLLLLTGDLSHDYSPASYDLVLSCCKHLAPLVAVTPGNHDNLEVLSDTLHRHNFSIRDKSFILGDWQIILINSLWSGHVAGFVTQEELVFLASALKEHPDKKTLIFLHHHLLPVGSFWLDNLGIKNADEVMDIVDKHQNVQAVICGHVHQDKTSYRNNIPYFSTPACGWQFAVNSSPFRLDTLMPGYRYFLLNEDSYETKVVRLPHNPEFVPDINTTGY